MLSTAVAGLVHLGQPDHDTALVHFKGLLLTSAIVTVGLCPAATGPVMLHEAALLVPLNVLLTVLRQ